LGLAPQKFENEAEELNDDVFSYKLLYVTLHSAMKLTVLILMLLARCLQVYFFIALFVFCRNEIQHFGC
jgi:uncharacterized membrane protein